MNRHKAFRQLALLTTFVILLSATALADGLNVLWYVYTPYAPTSNNNGRDIATLAAAQHWNVTYWGPGTGRSDVPNFSNYDVLVTQSWPFPNKQNISPLDVHNLTDPDYSGLLANGNAINAVRDNRTVITGLDADFHYLYGGLITNQEDAAGKALAAMINWAGGGYGLGLVALADFSGEQPGWEPNGRWWFQQGSPLEQELYAVTLQFGSACDQSNGPLSCIHYFSPSDSQPHITRNGGPMAGLTNADLALWGESYHSYFGGVLPAGYLGFADAYSSSHSEYQGYSVIATNVPEPTTLLLLAAGLGSLGLLRRKRS